ncbi:MAG: DUF6446 family protein [Paracoccus sp. (in: a-proteobacteria)]|nr:DUF6446 family protein [Paracoccus sp. (in: a-proteobacteria)]
MSSGKIAASMLVLTTILAGLAVWYLQVYGFYDEVDEITGAGALRITDTHGVEQPLAVGDFRAIDADSSPLRYRACFTVAPAALTDAAAYQTPTPLNGPNWFKCYSARGLTGDLESGAARAYLSQRDIAQGIDRVIAVYPDGRAFGWHQLNETAEESRGIE